ATVSAPCGASPSSTVSHNLPKRSTRASTFPTASGCSNRRTFVVTASAAARRSCARVRRGASPCRRQGETPARPSALSLMLVELNRPLVLLSCGAGLEGTEVLALAGLGVGRARIDTVFARFQLANHLSLHSTATATVRSA